MFKEINAREIDGNLIKMIADEWMLIAAGDSEAHNMMTASWGFAGEMWGAHNAIRWIFLKSTIPSHYRFMVKERISTKYAAVNRVGILTKRRKRDLRPFLPMIPFILKKRDWLSFAKSSIFPVWKRRSLQITSHISGTMTIITI